MNCNEKQLARLVAGVFSLVIALVPVALAQTQEPNAAKDSEPMTQATLNEQLLEACRDGQIDDVKELLEAGAGVNAPVGDSNSYGGVALIDASSQGHLDIMELLLDNGVDVNSQRDFGMTPLAAATRAGSREAVELLVNRGADVNQFPGDGSPPLISAANRNDPEIVKLLLEAGADVNITVSDSWTALMEACREGNLSVGEAPPGIWC